MRPAVPTSTALTIALLVALPMAAGAQTRVDVEPLECYPQKENGVIYANVTDEQPAVNTRLYFRWDESEPYYYTFMVPDGIGRYWTTPPKAGKENEGIEYYVAQLNPLGEVVAQSESQWVEVKKDCEIELDERQLSYANHLTVGETTFEQEREKLDGFECEGVVTRINPDNVWREDEVCRACLVTKKKKQPEIFVEPQECLTEDGHGIIYATVAGEVPPGPPRLYYRWEEGDTFHPLEMQPAGENRFWTPLPKPAGSAAANYFGVIVDQGLGVMARSKTYKTPVGQKPSGEACELPPLTPDQQNVADNLPQPPAPGSMAEMASRIVPKVDVAVPECYPDDTNGLIRASVSDELPHMAMRLYFRWDQDEDFYYVGMVPAGGRNYWTTPPRAKPENEGIEYYVAMVDPMGEVLSRSDMLKTPVTSDCDVQLTGRQFSYAANLTIGETTHEQMGEEVDGFECYGLMTRINPDLIWRMDEVCRKCVIPWWEDPVGMIPAATALIGGAIILTEPEPDASEDIPFPTGGGN